MQEATELLKDGIDLIADSDSALKNLLSYPLHSTLSRYLPDLNENAFHGSDAGALHFLTCASSKCGLLLAFKLFMSNIYLTRSDYPIKFDLKWSGSSSTKTAVALILPSTLKSFHSLVRGIN